MESSSPSSSRPAKRGKYANDENHGEHKDDGNDDSSNNGNGKSNRGENDDAGNRDDANDGNNNNSNANNDNSFHFHAQSEEERRACFIEMAWEHYRNYVDSIDRGEISDDDFSDDGENEEEAEDGHRDDGDGEARALPAEVSDVEDACNDERGKEGGREKERGGDERGADAEAEEEQVIIRRQIPMMDVAAAAAAAALEPPPPNNPPNHRDEEGPDVQTPGATAELHGLVFVLSHVSFSPFDDERFREAVAAREARGDDGKSQLIFPNVDSCMLPLLLSMAYVHLASHAISNTMFRDHDEVVREEGEEEEEEGEEEEEEEEEEQQQHGGPDNTNNNDNNNNNNNNNNNHRNPSEEHDRQVERLIGRHKRNPSYLFRKALHYWPKNPAALSLLANYHRMKLTGSAKEICRLYVEASEQARWWRKVAVEFLGDEVDYWKGSGRDDHDDNGNDNENYGSGNGDDARFNGDVSEIMTEKNRIKEWVELILLNGALGVDYVGDGGEDANHDQENRLRDQGDGYSFSEVEATSAFMAAMLLSTLGEHEEALTHLNKFPVSHRIHPNVWKAARSHDHQSDGIAMKVDANKRKNATTDDILFSPRIYQSDRGILPPHLYRRLCRLFAPDAPYWDESGYHHRGYYSYFIDLERKNDIRTNDGTITRKSVRECPTNVIEDVIVHYLLPLAERTLREEHVTKAAGEALGSGDENNDDTNGTANHEVGVSGTTATATTVPRIIGAEWWTHTRPLGANLGHQLHFDTDESLLGNAGKVTHPVISSVLYLTGGGGGKHDEENDASTTENEAKEGGVVAGSTIVFDQTPASEEVASQAWIGHARDNAFLNFPGNLLHGVLPCAGGREEEDDDKKREGDGEVDVKNEDKKKSGSKDDTGPHRLTFMVGFWTRNVPEGMGDDRKLYGPCGPLPPATNEHSWVVDCREGYPIRPSENNGDSAKDVWLKNVSHEKLPWTSPAWEVINQNQDDNAEGDVVASTSSSLVIPKGLDHRYFVLDAPDCFAESLFDKDETF